MTKWELFSHDADIGIRGVGGSIEKAFEMAAMALTAVVIDPHLIPCNKIVQIELEEQELDYLFYEWINHIIYEMDTKKMLFGNFEVKIINNKIFATLQGDVVEKIKGEFAVEIKGATLTELKVTKNGNNWMAQCVIDV